MKGVGRIYQQTFLIPRLQNSIRACENNSHSRNIDRETRPFCAFWSRESPVVTPGASTQVSAGNAPRITVVSRPDGRRHGLDAKDVEGPSQIVDERCKAELSPDIVEALHQKGALVHPLLDRAEGMLDHLAELQHLVTMGFEVEVTGFEAK